MKKLTLVALVVILMLGYSFKEDAFNIMNDAKSENRALTEKEIKIIESEVKQVKWKNTNDYDRALSAMYLNFNVDEKFEEAKELAENLR